MTEDPRCCGSGTCLIDADGRCWCGQQWDGHKMCHAPRASTGYAVSNEPSSSAGSPSDSIAHAFDRAATCARTRA
jgi:hypothetical protein